MERKLTAILCADDHGYIAASRVRTRRGRYGLYPPPGAKAGEVPFGKSV
jgi:hypothetical protein